MKKFLFIFCLMFLFISCSNDLNNTIQEHDYIQISFDYSFNSGNMTRSSEYSPFYDKIISKELVADSFNITLTEKNTNETYEFCGKWNSNDMLSIKPGIYKIVGTSIAPGNYIQNKCSLNFNTEIEIKSTDTCIILPAQYNCFLLIFSKETIKDVLDCYNTYYEDHNYFSQECLHFYTLNNYFYAFSYKLYNENYSSYHGTNAALKIILKNNSIIKFYTKTINFELGKYYIYNPVDNNFSIPEMQQGNI